MKYKEKDDQRKRMKSLQKAFRTNVNIYTTSVKFIHGFQIYFILFFPPFLFILNRRMEQETPHVEQTNCFKSYYSTIIEVYWN